MARRWELAFIKRANERDGKKETMKGVCEPLVKQYSQNTCRLTFFFCTCYTNTFLDPVKRFISPLGEKKAS